MSLDIVQIALERFTDHVKFEQLASEIMRDEGYSTIKPLGGTHDLGRDAEQETFFESEGKTRTVFQYTTQREGITSKIDKTVARLESLGIEYSELVLVTSHAVSSHRQDELRKKARTKHGIVLNIYDHKTLVNRLSDYSNGIFRRYFPDIQTQLKDLTVSRPALSEETASDIEISVLKAATTLTFGKGSRTARNSIFDQLTLSIIINNHPDAIHQDTIIEEYKNLGPLNRPSTSQIDQALERLTTKKLINTANGEVTASQLAIETWGAVTIEVRQATNSLISDIVDKVCDIYEEPLANEVRNKIARNVRESLASYFQLFGLELSNQFLREGTPSPVYLEASNRIIAQARRQLPRKVGEALVNTIADTLSNTPNDHIDTLANWSLAFLGIQIMNLDPISRELEISCFSRKTFILDTDFILDCVVRECPKSTIFVKLVKDLLNLGCRVVIPFVVVNECIAHAKFSYKTYRYFGESIFSYDKAYVEEIVWNAFVRGYYYASNLTQFASRTSYSNFLSNYYDEEKPFRFFEEVIRSTMPTGVEIFDLGSLLTTELPKDQMKNMKKELLELSLRKKKAKYRTKEENEELAETDAILFLTALHLNTDEEIREDTILGGTHYLLTSSPIYLMCAKRVGIRDVVTTRPQSIASMLEIIGETSISSSELLQLFENPFLIHAVKNSYSDVKRLVGSGVDIRGKSLARLRWDLEERFHSRLALIHQVYEIEEVEEDVETEDKDTDQFFNLLMDARDSGYRLIPEIEKLLNKLEKGELEIKRKEDELEEIEKMFKDLEDQFNEFGKRKQRFLRRMARRAKSKQSSSKR